MTEPTVATRWDTRPQPNLETDRLLFLLFGEDADAEADVR